MWAGWPMRRAYIHSTPSLRHATTFHPTFIRIEFRPSYYNVSSNLKLGESPIVITPLHPSIHPLVHPSPAVATNCHPYIIETEFHPTIHPSPKPPLPLSKWPFSEETTAHRAWLLPRSAPNCCDYRRRDGAGNALLAQDRSRAFQRAFDCPRRLKVQRDAAVVVFARSCFGALDWALSRVFGVVGSVCTVFLRIHTRRLRLICCVWPERGSWEGTKGWSRRFGGVPCFGSLVWGGSWNLVSF